MKSKSGIYFLIIILVFTRVFIENSLAQIGMQDETWSRLVFCSSVGCFLNLKYRLFLEIISFVAYFTVSKHILKISKRESIITAFVFILIFMIFPIYRTIGILFFEVILADIELFRTINPILYWSIPGVVGAIICIIIMTFGLVVFNRLFRRNTV